MITITDRARAHVLDLIRENNLGDVALRLGASGGGCAGFSYELSFERAAREGDKIYDVGDLKIAVDKLSRPFVGHTQIDYEETPYGSGFSFADPQAASTCGCGQSFNVQETAADPDADTGS